MSRKMRLVCGSSHPALGERIAEELGIPLMTMGLSRFSNGEVRIKPSSDPEFTLRGARVFVLQTGGSTPDGSINDYLVELLLIMDACRRGGCSELNLLIPCYPYARQDKKDTSRAPISAKAVARMLESQRLDRIVCIDLHNSCIQGMFECCCDNLFVTTLMTDWFQRNVFRYAVTARFVLIAPDAGASEKVEKVAKYMKLPFLTMNKTRSHELNNVVHGIQLMATPEMLADAPRGRFLTHRVPIIVDDMIDTCGTVIKAVDKLAEYGAEECIVAATHGVLSGPALDRINACPQLSLVVVSDSLPQQRNLERCSKLRVFGLAGFLAEVVRRTLDNRSLGDMF